MFRTPSAKGTAKVSLSLPLAGGMGCQWDPVAEGAGGISVMLPKESRAGHWDLGQGEEPGLWIKLAFCSQWHCANVTSDTIPMAMAVLGDKRCL